MKIPILDRRQWLKVLGVASGSLPALFAAPQSSEKSFVFPGKRSMIVHNDFPEDLETPVDALTTWITPNDAFFVRQHLPRPRVSAGAYQLEITGLVSNKTALSLADLQKLPQVTVPATLECAGNGRGNFKPRMPGLQWSKGAMGNAEWRGPRLSEVLKKAGVSGQATYANFDGADVGLATTPNFIRSIPMRKVMHESTILALQMNGETIPEIHGFPARLIVPGWDGASWVKWVTSIELADKIHGGFYMQTAYRYPRYATAPGGAAKPEELDVIEGMAVKSFFTRPADQSKIAKARTTFTGIAWAGEEKVTRVEISTDGGSRWQDAKMGKEDFRFAWRLWSFEWTPSRPGYHLLMSRATDSAGRVQPIEPAWNPSGYLWNGIDKVGVTVEG